MDPTLEDWAARTMINRVDPDHERKQAEALAKCKHGKKAWVWFCGEMTDTARCQACGASFTPNTMKQDKSQ